MDNEKEQIEYIDVLADIGSLIQQYGAIAVASDLKKFYPAQAAELGKALTTKTYQVAALLKP